MTLVQVKLMHLQLGGQLRTCGGAKLCAIRLPTDMHALQLQMHSLVQHML